MHQAGGEIAGSPASAESAIRRKRPDREYAAGLLAGIGFAGIRDVGLAGERAPYRVLLARKPVL
jgi:hypothetical protein